MAWTSMHFAVGMCGGAALSLAACMVCRRGWRLVPIGMTFGGIWALIPDLPRIWREDFPSLPFAATLGSKDMENWLHSIGDLFFFHHSLDGQPKEFALLGLAVIIGLYNLSLLGLIRPARRKRNDPQASGYERRTENQPRIDTGLPINHDPHPPVIARINRNKSA